MNNIYFSLFFIFFHTTFSSEITLDITRTKSYNSYTPLNVHLETPDVKERKNPVDLILLVDDSGSMRGQKITLVKETITELINLMGEDDRLAIVKFSDNYYTLFNLTYMNSSGKQTAKNALKNFIAYGGTNIYSSLLEGYRIFSSIDYTTNDRFPTMILLSDGYDNYSNVLANFKSLLSSKKKELLKIPFTLHSFGYGSSHDSNLMNELCKLRDGAYFSIFHLANVKNAWIEIFGHEVTMIGKYVQLKVESFNFTIVNLFGKNDMIIKSSSKFNYEIEIIHLRAGKSYDFVFEVDIPEGTKIGEKILNATILDLEKIYKYEDEYDNNAFEEYFRSIVFKNLSDSFYMANRNPRNINAAKNLLEKVKNWINENYEGLNEWDIEISECIAMFDKFDKEGKGDILSRIREGVSQKPGIHYNEENSYQNLLIEKAYVFDLSQKYNRTITPNSSYSIYCNNTNSTLYFYSDKGIVYENSNIFVGEINNAHESVLYLKENSRCNLNIKSNSKENFNIFFWEEKKENFLNVLEFGTKSLINIERNFPIEFYTLVDGTKDVNFNIQFLDLQKNKTEYESNTTDIFKIEAYIIDETKINNTMNLDSSVFNGFYDAGFRMGKVLITRTDVRKNMNTLFKNYVCVKISNLEDSENQYKKIKAIVSFTNLNNIYKPTPSNSYIISNLLPNKKRPNLYLFKNKLESEKFRLEFCNSNSELDFALLNFTKFEFGDERFYKNDSKLQLVAVKGMGKNYIDIQTEDSSINSIILSIFSKNSDHEAGSEINKNSYIFNYSITTDNDFNNINTYDLTLGENVTYYSEITSDTKKKITIEFPKIINNFTKEIVADSKYFFKFYPIFKRNQKLYNTINLFEENPYLTMEIENIKDNNFLKCSISDFPNTQNYFLIISSLSENLNTYKPLGIFRDFSASDPINITDDMPFGLELTSSEDSLNLTLNITNATKNYLVIQTTDFEDNNFVPIFVTLNEKTLKSIQPSNNYLIIPKKLFDEEEDEIIINLKTKKNKKFYLYIELTDTFELNVNENLVFEYLEEYGDSFSINLINKNENKSINVFVKPSYLISNDFNVESYNVTFEKSLLLNGVSANFPPQENINLKIKGKKGDIISIFTRITQNQDHKNIEYNNFYAYGFLDSKDCFYFNDLNPPMRYQVRVIGDKKISLKYFYANDNKTDEETIDILNENEYYYKELNEQLTKICLRQINNSDTIFFSLQVVKVDNQQTSSLINLPLVFNMVYKDSLRQNEVRYYTQGVYENNTIDEELKYIFNLNRLKGEVVVYYDQCDDYPNCLYSKEILEANSTFKKLFNIDEVFIHSKNVKDVKILDNKKPFVYIVLCLSEFCSYEFNLQKSDEIKNLNQIKKYSGSIKKTQIDKFSIKLKDENQDVSKIIVTLFTHTGEVMLNTNNNCDLIKHSIIGHIEKIEIPKECDLNILREIYVEANFDSTYSIEYFEESSQENVLNSNIVRLESFYKEKTIIFEKKNNNYFVAKFVPVNCEIEVKKDDQTLKKDGNLFYDLNENSDVEFFRYEITSNSENECLFYTFSEEFSDNFYNILSEQVPYYLSLFKEQKYKLLFPLPNNEYDSPLFRINFIEEIPLKINKFIGKENEGEIEIATIKNLHTEKNFLEKNCNENEICYLILEIEYEPKENRLIHIEIVPKTKKEIPALLLPNVLKQDFIQFDSNQFYMTKLNKDIEGEIHFNYKRSSALITSKIVNIEKNSWKNNLDLPKKDENLLFDNFKQSLIFTKKETNKCENGCYLFIGVYPEESYANDTILNDIFLDYTIFYIENNFNENVVDIKLNDFIQNSIEKINNIEFYSLEIPYPTKSIYFDVSGSKGLVFTYNIGSKPSLNYKENDFYKELDDGNSIIKIEEKIEKKFIIGMFATSLNDGIGQFSFRARVDNQYYKEYIYTDTNTETICNINNNNENCVFLIPVLNNKIFAENAQNLFLYAFSSANSENLILSFSKVNLNKKEEIHFEFSTENQFIKNMLTISNDVLKTLKKGEDILIKVFVPEKGTITLLNTFKTNLKESFVHFKSRIVYNVEPNKELLLNVPSGHRNLVHINVIDGEGKIGFENDEKQIINGKYSAFYLQFEENNNEKIKVKTEKLGLKFYVYLKIGTNKRNINQISLGTSAKFSTKKGFPVEFYFSLPENIERDFNINFRVNNIKEFNDDFNKEITEIKTSKFNIKVFVVDEKTIEKIKNDENIIYSGNELNTFEGKYEAGFGISKIILKKESLNSYAKNYIYIKIDADASNIKKFSDINAELNVFEVNNIDYYAPNNVYLNGNLDHQNNKNEFKIIKKNEKDKKIRVELSSSEIVSFSISLLNISQVYKFLSEDITYEVSKGLGKKYIDINVEAINNPLLFTIYHENLPENKNIYFSFKYKSGNDFKNYVDLGNKEGLIENEWEKEKNKLILNFKFFSIIDKETSIKVDTKYYLKIYKHDQNEIVINNTISVVDNISPVLSFEYNFEVLKDFYEKELEIENVKNDENYYATLTAIVVDDDEFVAYKSFSFKKIEKDKEKSKSKFWIVFIIIIIVLIIVGVLICIYFKKNKNNNSNSNSESSMNELSNIN